MILIFLSSQDNFVFLPFLILSMRPCFISFFLFSLFPSSSLFLPLPPTCPFGNYLGCPYLWFKDVYLYCILVCVHVWPYACVCRYCQGSEKSITPLGARVTGICEPSDVGAGPKHPSLWLTTSVLRCWAVFPVLPLSLSFQGYHPWLFIFVLTQP